MTLTLNEIIAATESYNKINKEKFSLKTSYKLARLFKDLEVEVKCYEEAIKNTILKYAKKDENGQPIINSGEKGDSVEISPEQQIECTKEIEELNNTPISINDYYFSLEDFGDFNVSIEEIKGLLPFIKD